ncbi:MAG: glycoside hydrolase family 5 protein [Aurantibacter sp.]
MKKVNRVSLLLILILVGSCGKDDPKPPLNKSVEADLLRLDLEYMGTTYTTTISGTTVSLSNLLPSEAQEVIIKSIELSSRAISDKKAGDKLQLGQNPLSIQITAEDGTTEKNYSLNLETAAPVTALKPFGVNLAGAEFGSPNFPGTYDTDYIYPNTEELDYYKSKGLNLIRMPFSWERIQPILNGNLDEVELNRIKDFLQAARNRNMAVVLDLHNYGRYYLNGKEEIIGSPNLSIIHIKDLWTKLSFELKDNSEIWGYGIMNEPHDMLAAASWFDIAQEIINGIRTSDARTRIIVGGDSWSSAEFWPLFSDNLRNLSDPSNNLTFEAHVYFDNDSSGRYDQNYDDEGAYPDKGIDRVTPFLDWLETNELNGFVGEYGVPGNDARWLTMLDNLLLHLETKGINGAYWAGGPWWGDYILSIEPNNGADKAQMEIVQKYLEVN